MMRAWWKKLRAASYAAGQDRANKPAGATFTSSASRPASVAADRCVMCCDCGRVMSKNGNAGATLRVDGLIRFDKLQGNVDVAWFQDNQAADQAAESAGWRTRDHLGSNHRCPECAAKPTQSRVRGAFIERPEVTK